MQGSFVVLTGASGSGKTTLARAFQETFPSECDVLFFDSVGVPSPEKMKEWGGGYRPGGAWQRAMTIQWIEQIAAILQTGRSVLFEGQMRIAFIHEALLVSKVTKARVILVDCDEATRAARLRVDRGQPELANSQMMSWAQYLREEAMQSNCEILDTGTRSHKDCLDLLRSYLGA
jgi:dephospho-CoA kinase